MMRTPENRPVHVVMNHKILEYEVDMAFLKNSHHREDINQEDIEGFANNVIRVPEKIGLQVSDDQNI